MSHWVKVGLQIKEEKTLVAALKEMGVECKLGTFTISQYGKSESCSIMVDEGVGFSKQADGTFSMVGDFYHTRHPKLREYYNQNKKFQSDMSLAYAKANARQQCVDLGFEITENDKMEIGADGMIRVVATNGF